MIRTMKILLVLCAVALVISANAQDNAESRANTIRSMPADTARVDAMNALVAEMLNNNTPLAMQLARESADWSRSIHYPFGELKSESLLGYCYLGVGEYDTAREHLQRSIDIAEKVNNLEGRAIGYSGMGNAYYFQSLYPRAIEWWLKAAKLGEEKKDTVGVVANLCNIGSVYMDMGNDASAMEYFEKAYNLITATNHLRNRSEILGNMAIVYQRRKEYEKAGEFYNKALEIARLVQNEVLVTTSVASLGMHYRAIGEFEKALDYVRQSLDMSRRIESPDDEAYALLLIGQCLYDFATKNQTAWINENFGGDERSCLRSALAYHDSAITIYAALEMPDRLKMVYESKSSVQEALGDHEAALKSFRLATQLKDSLFSLDLDRKLAQTTMQYEFDKKEESIRVEQEKKDIRQRNIQNSIGAGLVCALIFSGVVLRQRNKISKARKRSDELLLNILPEEVAEELKAKGEAEAKQIDEVTVLFTDFKGFTALSETLSPKELVRDLNECFSAFDRIMQKYGIEKIKTIGDAYMAAGGLPVPNSTHAVDVVKAAIEIREFMLDGKAKKIAQQLPYFEIRIGIHTGPVVAGIVGVKKFAYDIWGDTVNTASRMESSGEVGKINISDSTYQLVKDQFNCVHRGKITAKGKGDIDMYFVDSLN
jgi:class 3 adenylate cyclase/Tfp pilus assembly protein PilF